MWYVSTCGGAGVCIFLTNVNCFFWLNLTYKILVIFNVSI